MRRRIRARALLLGAGIGLVLPGQALAASLVACPAGATNVSVVNSLAGGGSPSGPRDDGSFLVGASTVNQVFPSGIPFITTANSFYINANGNISFGTPVSTYTPEAIPGLTIPTIAPFFGDVDFSDTWLFYNPGDLRLCTDVVNKRIMVTWQNVGFYDANWDWQNTFQAILSSNEPSVCDGTPSFNVEFRYNKLQWTTGDSSGGYDGLGGTQATAGIDAGNVVDAVALPGSGTSSVLNLTTATNVNQPGVFRYLVAQGKLPSCGNSTKQVCEQCDDGNASNNDACTNLCRNNVCGDGFVHNGVEACDGSEFAPGSKCPAGYTGAPTCNSDCTLNVASCSDVNECANPALNDCSSNANCANTPGSFTCTCKDGYQGDGKTCTDVNECTTGADNCDENATCTNTPGSFTCKCIDGYSGDGVTCNDVDECADAGAVCGENAHCTNVGGGFDCECADGYTGDGQTCVNIDECSDPALNECDDNAKCSDTPGGYTCECQPGFIGDGKTCTDIDECTDPALFECDANATCHNTPGSYTCECNDGFAGDGKSCVTTDECSDPALNDCSENATCTDTATGYDCTCAHGYTGDGKTCDDIDECEDPSQNNCDANATCTNTPGGYTCECNDGFDTDGKLCIDHNECEDNGVACDENATCSNAEGTYTCECKPGYTGDGATCTDVDECADPQLNSCDENATCSNTDGSFTCECKEGFEGDGKLCKPVDGGAGGAGGAGGGEPTAPIIDGTYQSGGCACSTANSGDTSGAAPLLALAAAALIGARRRRRDAK